MSENYATLSACFSYDAQRFTKCGRREHAGALWTNATATVSPLGEMLQLHRFDSRLHSDVGLHRIGN